MSEHHNNIAEMCKGKFQKEGDLCQLFELPEYKKKNCKYQGQETVITERNDYGIPGRKLYWECKYNKAENELEYQI